MSDPENTVILTGHSGFLGKYLMDALQKSGASVLTVGRSVAGSPDHISADLTKPFVFPQDCKPSMVVHAAGKAHMVPRTEEEKNAFTTVNVDGVRHLLQALDALSVRPRQFVFISSVGVYGLDEGEEIHEYTALASKEPYGLTKIEAENLVRKWGTDNNVPVLILRLPLIAGANPPGNLGSMMRGMQTGKYFRIGNGSARKSMVLASDVARLVASANGKSGTYHLTDGRHPSFAELEDALIGPLGIKGVRKMPLWLASSAALAGTMAESVLGKRMPISNRLLKKITRPLTFSDAKARKELGWNPRSVTETINELIS